MVDTFHLFPAVDEMLAAGLKREAVEVCSHLLEDIISSLPLTGGGETLDSVSSETAESSVSLAGHLEDGESSLADQTLAMDRETDKTARIQVLLRLIKLACTMVSES